MSQWVNIGVDVYVLTIGMLRAVVRPVDVHGALGGINCGFEWLLVGTMYERWLTPPSQAATIDDGKAAAEKALLEMGDALVSHSAPVLQWQQPQPCDGSIVARVGQWVLHASSEKWSIFVDSPGPRWRVLIASEVTCRVDPMVNFRAAQDTLRNKLGVVFRVEVSNG